MIIYFIINKANGREAIVTGGSNWMEAARHSGFDPAEWYLDSQEYID